MSELRRADAHAREEALDVTRSFIVQAPAGSGKTELLTRRCLALLATVPSPESILALTFTRKAAAEMRNRVLGALRAAATPDGAPSDLQPRTLALARAALARDHSLGWDLLGNPARLRIQTIDALNLGLARRLPLLSGLGAGLGVEEDAQELYRTAAERLLEHLPGDDRWHADAVATLLAHLDNRVPAFVDLVVEMLSRRESWAPVLPAVSADEPDAADLRRSLEAARQRLVTEHLAGLRRAFTDDELRATIAIAREAAGHLVAAGKETPLAVWADHEHPPTDAASDAMLWLGLATLLLTQAGELRKSFDVRIGFPPGAATRMLKQKARDVVDSLAGRDEVVQWLDAVRRLPAVAYSDTEWRVLRAQFVVLRLAMAELELVFAERRVADYPRFATAARQALGSADAPTDTALALDARLRHVLVDEFQDTSEAQVKLLEALTAGWERGDGRTLFCVGDPMQSIYRFRHAEVGLFLEVRERGLGGLPLESLTLAVNFRSTQPVMDWVNACFERVLPARDDALTGAIRYSPGTCAEGAGEEGGVKVHALFRRSRGLEARSIADVVEQRLREDADARVAILVLGRRHLVDVVAELARRNVPFQATDIDPLGERPIVLDLLALARAIAHAADRPAWLAVLRAPWCGLSLADLHTLCGDELEATLPELLRDEARRALLPPDSRARLERAWSILSATPVELRRFGLRDTVERAWLALGGPATAQSPRGLDEAQACLDELAALEERSAGPLDLAALADALEKLYAPSRPSPEVRVELLTVHKAKGLQFDTVIVPGLDRPPRADGKRLLQWAQLPGADRDSLVVAPVAAAGAAPDRLYAWLQGLEAAKLAEEKRRLLYVAATRAQRWLHLYGTCPLKDQDAGPPAIVTPKNTVALGLLWPVVEDEFARRLQEIGGVAGEAPPEIPRDPPLRRLPLTWRLPELLSPQIESVRSARKAETAVRFDWATETTRHVGTVVHRQMQRIACDGAPPRPDDAATRRLYGVELAELGVPAEHRDAGVARAITAVQRTLDDARGRWLLDRRHASAANELALTGRIDGETVSVVIDRTFVDAEGTRWIVDYKTSTHEGADLEAFLVSEEERYRPQLERYAALAGRMGPEPVQLGLYFPLLSAWRPVKTQVPFTLQE